MRIVETKRLPRPHRIVREWIIPPPLTQSQVTVLQTLVKQAPTNAYQISKKIDKAYSLVLGAMKELKKRGMIEFRGEAPTEKGTKAHIYDLTLRGVLFVLRRKLVPADAELWNYGLIHDVIAKYDFLLPLVLGKWRYFEKIGVGKMALFRLKVTIDSLGRLDDPRFQVDIQQIRQAFYFFGFFPPRPFLEGSGIMAQPKVWTSAWKQDKDIKEWVLSDLEDYLKELESAVLYVKKAITSVMG